MKSKVKSLLRWLFCTEFSCIILYLVSGKLECCEGVSGLEFDYSSRAGLPPVMTRHWTRL